MSVNVKEVQKLLSPNPFCLITTMKPEGQVNIMPLSWWSWASSTPPLLTIACSQHSYTAELIIDTGNFGLCMPGIHLTEKAMRCGMTSGRDSDKVSELGIQLTASANIDASLVAGCRVALECELRSHFDAGDHTIFVAEVVRAHTNENIDHLYAFDGYSKLGVIAGISD